ncbi:hypothetical protein GCM10009838_48870 [Catenulispora subtropica]|uniref:PBS lyase HEAT domain protein repeat-containing protein n=1 Tax=Catenulispora subtropica TaxID=450798 RepID=A0ABP5DPF4_9ACTN
MRWSALTHAYGPATDTPELLRQLASDDPGRAHKAVAGLWGSLCHQGSVYLATPFAVPFLARLAAAGVRTTGLLALLGSIAESRGTRASDPADAARRAVADACGPLVPLLAADDPEVRSTTGWMLAQTRRGDLFAAAVAERWEHEPDTDVRCGLLRALHQLDPELVGGFASVVGAEQPPELRMVAAYVLTATGAPWDAAMFAAATAWMTHEREARRDLPWNTRFQDLVEVVFRQHGVDTAVSVVAHALGTDGPVPESVRLRGIDAAQDLVGRSRHASVLLVPLLAPLAGPDKVGVRALEVLRLIGPAAAAAATDAVLAVADRPGADQDADIALATLFEWRVPAALDLLARDLPDRPRALEAAANPLPNRPNRTRLPFHAGLFAAVRSRLRDLAAPSASGASRPTSLRDRTHALNEPVYLCNVLSAWGHEAADAVPDVLAVLDFSPFAASRTLATSGVATPEVVEALRHAAQDGGFSKREAVSLTLRGLTGDEASLLAAVETGLAGTGHELAAAAHAAAQLTEHSERLVPLLSEALARPAGPTRTTPDTEARIHVAHALWSLGAGPEAAVEVYADAFTWADSAIPSTWTVIAAIRAAAELGTAGAPLVPALTRLLEVPEYCSSAADALRAVRPAEFDTEAGQRDLAAKLVAALAASTQFMYQRPVVDALAALEPAAISGDVRLALEDLAARDERLVRHGTGLSPAGDDEALRRRIEDLLTRDRPEHPPEAS